MPNEVQDTPSTFLSRRAFIGTAAVASASFALVLAGPYSPVHAATGPAYQVQWNRRRQTILGLGFEIQSDSIGSGNNGLPEATTSVPHDLVPGERNRLYAEMLRAGGAQGFRYCRLAMGLYLRGLTDDKKNVVGRWPEQMAELAEMMKKGKIEGAMVEYWSPTPYWKSTDSYIRGTLKSDDQAFLSDFADALVRDVKYLEDNGVPVSWWGLQNEPVYETPYSSCLYSSDLYYRAFRTTASRVRANFPDVRIHATSISGQYGPGAAAIRQDSDTLSLVDGWTWHKLGDDAKGLLPGNSNASDDLAYRAVFNNEFEYLSWNVSRTPWYTVNTAQSIMNWMTFHDSPTWIWLHALKPTYNSEALGYSLGFWRPWDDDDMIRFPSLSKGTWTWNDMNWNAVAGFLRNMPWDSVRVEVDEPTIDSEHRIMAWMAPNGQRTFAITNRAATAFSYQVNVDDGSGTAAMFVGSRYAHDLNNAALGAKQGPALALDIPAYSIEFWTEQS